MENKFKLKTYSVPKMMGDILHSNQFLKVFSILSLILTFLSIIMTYISFNRGPIVLAFNPEAKILNESALPSVESAIREAVNSYISLRYNWNPKNIKDKFKNATQFILPKNVKGFEDAMNDIKRFSLEKEVSQKVYLENIQVNLKDSSVSISGDRITSIQGMKAAGDLKILLLFENGPRTKENPWGIYVIKEKEGE